ncbi:MAG: Outer-membrane lipoprotein carrier protein [Legionellaceae bacterium]
MSLFNKLSVLIIGIFFTSTLNAQTAMGDLAQKLNYLKTMQAHFEQQIIDGKGNVIQSTEGEFALSKPGKFRWETIKPNRQLLIADGKKIWIYDQDLQQATVQKQNINTSNSPAILLTGSVEKLKKDFQVKRIQRNNKPWFLLIPKSGEALFKKVELYFNEEKLKEMHLIDHLGHESFLSFHRVIMNQPISLKQFIFIPPKDIDLIE